MDCLFSPLLEVFQQGTWVQLQNLEDPELAEIAKQLPSTVLRSRANSSTKKYLHGGIQMLEDMGQKLINSQCFQLSHAPCLIQYLQHIGNQAKSKSAAEEAVMH